MKPEEASQAIRDSYIPKMFTALEEALEVAIQALEKKVPKKPRIINGGTNTCHDTDCCNDVLRWYSYCPVCGQAIDWSKSE